MIILSLDQAKNLGYCVMEADVEFQPALTSIIKSGNIVTTNKQGIDSILDIEACVIDLINKYDPDWVVIEDIYLRFNVDTFKYLAKLMGVLERLFIVSDINYKIIRTVNARTCISKQYGFEKGKSGVQKFIVDMFPEYYSNTDISPDEADAVLLAYHFACNYTEKE